MNAVELFVGAGGLGMGTSFAGFKHVVVVDWNHSACETIRYNQRMGVEPITNWPLVEQDVCKFNFRDYEDRIHLAAGGPPCQPFSIGGRHKGFKDKRDMFPEAVRAIREIRPRAFMFENVRGLARQSFAKYFGYILLQLTYPDLVRDGDDSWEHHLARLEQHHTGGQERGLHYNVVFRVLNAANYGVPQKRERVFIIGFRSDLAVNWSFPDTTHSKEALLWSQWHSEEYWERHRIPRNRRPQMPLSNARLVEKLQPPSQLPWITVRDAFEGLPDLFGDSADTIPNHKYQPGARTYAGHTGSPLDEPSKTLKAGDHGVPGGENMLVLPDGKVRYFTVRESARIQTFPDTYLFNSTWTESMRQIGNAVPVKLAHIVAESIYRHLEEVERNG